MEEKDLPQHNSATYAGHNKVMYATRDGRYVKSASSGWEDEAYATEQVVDALARQTAAARQAVLAGTHSPLYFLMSAFRHDEVSLAQAVGLFRWQVRRHCRPDIYARLPEKTLARYAAVLQLDPALLHLPFDPDAVPVPRW